MGHRVTAKPTQRQGRMSPVTLAELDTKSRALATVEQETLPTLGDPATMTDDELANVVIEGVKKIRQILPYIVAIKARFDSGDRDRTNRLKIPIKGCFSWAEFCKTRLGRTRQTIHEALAPEPPLAPTPKPVASTCPDCGESFDSRGQLRRHGQSEHNIPTTGIANFFRRANGERALQAVEETHWISKENHCPTGKRGFDYPDDIWHLMLAEGSIGATDFIAYIQECGQCGRCHRDKDQQGHKEGDVPRRHQTWYRPDELNQPSEPSPTVQLREWFAKKYEPSKLSPLEQGRYDLALFNLTLEQVKTIGELLGKQS